MRLCGAICSSAELGVARLGMEELAVVEPGGVRAQHQAVMGLKAGSLRWLAEALLGVMGDTRGARGGRVDCCAALGCSGP